MATRIFDILFSGVLLILLSPLFLIIAVLIKLDSRGPVFFKQERMGKGGKPFLMYKFRTMFHNPDYKGPNLTRNNDPRITFLGAILRYTKLDELPQLLNVFKGEMSVVGPRPEYPSHLLYFTEEEKKLLAIKPGMVGPGQICERHEVEHYPDGVDVEEYYISHLLHKKLALELKYLQQKSLLYDLLFILKTAYTLLFTTFRLDLFYTNKKRIVLFFQDLCLIAFSYYCAFLLRYEFYIDHTILKIFLDTLPYVIAFRIFCFLFFRLYHGIAVYASMMDIFNISKAVAVSTLFIFFKAYVPHYVGHPRSVFIIDSLLIFLLISLSRFSIRIIREIQLRRQSRSVNNTLIVGALRSSENFVRQLLYSNPSQFNIVGFIDDNPNNRGKMIHGIKVLGTGKEISDIIRLKEIKTVIVMKNYLRRNSIGKFIKENSNGDYQILIASQELRNGFTQKLENFQDFGIEDMIVQKGRNGMPDYSEFFKDKNVLITGAAGVVGSELSRRIIGFNPEKLMLLDRDGNGLLHLIDELKKKVNGKNLMGYHYDIANPEKMEELFRRESPQIVYHCARENRTDLFYDFSEAINTNIFGTKILAELVVKYGVSKLIMVSTDKAKTPVNLVGFTMRVGEMLVQRIVHHSKHTIFSISRIGNIVESPQGVFQLIRKAIDEGGPIQLSNPQSKRTFVRVADVVSGLIDIAMMGQSGDLLFFRHGRHIKIEDLAKELVSFSGLKLKEDIEIQLTEQNFVEPQVVDGNYPGSLVEPTSFPDIFRIPYEKEIELLSPEVREKIEKILNTLLNGEGTDVYCEIEQFIDEKKISQDKNNASVATLTV